MFKNGEWIKKLNLDCVKFLLYSFSIRFYNVRNTAFAARIKTFLDTLKFTWIKKKEMREELLEKRLITQEVIGHALTYEQYYPLIKNLVQKGKTTGILQDQSFLKFTRLNFHRMKRVYRTSLINERLKKSIQKIDVPQIWLILSEGWCGDAAQILPAIARMADLTEKIELRILLRDENPRIMDAYLTDGSRSIPKLIVLDKDSLEELFTWGPRPKHFQEMVTDHKKSPRVSNEDFNEHLHKQNTLDRTGSLQEEIHQLI